MGSPSQNEGISSQRWDR